MDSICTALSSLVKRLPENVFVVIIVDGLKFSSQPEKRERQMRVMISHLVAMFQAQLAAVATLKLPLASTARSVGLEDVFDDNELLSIQRALPTGPDNDVA